MKYKLVFIFFLIVNQQINLILGNSAHKIYPYLLKIASIHIRAEQVDKCTLRKTRDSIFPTWNMKKWVITMTKWWSLKSPPGFEPMTFYFGSSSSFSYSKKPFIIIACNTKFLPISQQLHNRWSANFSLQFIEPHLNLNFSWV